MKDVLKNKKILLILTIILGLGISLSIIYFVYYYKDSRLNSLTNGLISIEFHETSTVILSSDVPVLDEIGLEGSPYEFTMKNTSQVPINANIKINPTISTNIPLGAVRYGLYINNELVKKDYIHEDKILYTFEELLVDEEISCKIYFWIDYYYDEPGKTFEASIIAEGETRDILLEPVTVTFDANGGTVDTQSKVVGIGTNYGRLPTPTREGYIFMGWNGKNLLNLEDFNYEDEVTAINNTDIIIKKTDTTYFYKSSNNIKLENGKNYILCSNFEGDYTGRVYSFFGTSLWDRYKQSDNKIYMPFTYDDSCDKNGFVISQNNQDMTSINMNLSTDEVILTNVMLEEGETATEYEPYYVTSNVKVTQTKNHTLKAIWKERDHIAPTLSLSKETYLTENFNNCNLTNATVTDGIVSLNTTSSSVNCGYYDINYGSWYITYDGFTTASSEKHDPSVGSAGPGSGGINSWARYYDEQYNSMTATNGYAGNGNSPQLPLNTWSNDFKFEYSNATNFKYLRIEFKTGNDYSQPTTKIRNLKIYGDAIPNNFYLINITSSDNVGVVLTKYASGNQTTNYFKTNGTEVLNNQIRVTTNGIYTVYVRDEEGNETIQTINITDIQ